jgi:predicted esterase
MPRMTPFRTWWCHRIVCLVLLGLLLLTTGAMADIVFMDDGFVLRGKIQREGDFWVQSGDVWIPRAGGFYMVDDGVRRVVFNQRHVSEAMPDPEEKRQVERIDFGRPPLYNSATKVAYSLMIEQVGAWKPTGERSIRIHMGGEYHSTLDQVILEASPYGVRMATRNYRWRAGYLTQEFPPTELLPMLNRQLNKNKKEPPLARRMRLFRFGVQAGWFEYAEAEMKSLLNDFPEQKDELNKAYREMKGIIASKKASEMQQAERAGQWLRLRQMLADFADEGASDETLTKVHILRSRLQEQTADLEAIRRYLSEFRRQISDVNFQSVTQELLNEIDQSVNIDTAPRLAAMLLLAKQEESRRTRNLKAELSPEQLLSLALSGWILGAPGAETRTDIALELCRAREFLKHYLRTDNQTQRETMLEDYLRQSPAKTDVLMQILKLLPPQAAQALPPENSFEARTSPSNLWKNGIPYRLQLPPEYHHHRSYPLLVVLPNLEETTKETMTAWGELAAKAGFFLVAIEWADDTKTRYEGTPKEHAAVLDTLKELRRKYNIDSDRIFLAGYGVAGTVTYDVALTAPDQFAAAVVICGNPSPSSANLYPNAQYLPFYVVDGDKTPERPKATRSLYEHWIGMGCPCMYVEYMGRSHEPFQAELPIIVDWLGRRKRSHGYPELGKPEIGNRPGQELRTYRDTARHFYWLSTEGAIPSRGVKLAAHTTPGNALAVYTTNATKVSVWLNSLLVDFEQPIDITVNPRSGSGRRFQKKISPNVRILLEDFYQRQDRSLLFLGRVDFDLK